MTSFLLALTMLCSRALSNIDCMAWGISVACDTPCSDLRCRSEEQTRQNSMQLSLQAAEGTEGDQPASSNSAASCRDGAKALKKCTCKKSKCLKLYCDCFAAGVLLVHCVCVVNPSMQLTVWGGAADVSCKTSWATSTGD